MNMLDNLPRFLWEMGLLLFLVNVAPGLLVGAVLVAVDAVRGRHRALPEIVNGPVCRRAVSALLRSDPGNPSWTREERANTRAFLDWFLQSVLAEYAILRKSQS